MIKGDTDSLEGLRAKNFENTQTIKKNNPPLKVSLTHTRFINKKNNKTHKSNMKGKILKLYIWVTYKSHKTYGFIIKSHIFMLIFNN